MPACDNCGAHVSREYRRVFSDQDGVVYACPDCSRSSGIGAVIRRRKQES